MRMDNSRRKIGAQTGYTDRLARLGSPNSTQDTGHMRIHTYFFFKQSNNFCRVFVDFREYSSKVMLRNLEENICRDTCEYMCLFRAMKNFYLRPIFPSYRTS